ncbi:MAG: alkaline phosphatase [Pirellulales bacterium]|nr:alkaline phosphatase [Pirellulales bacterium]
MRVRTGHNRASNIPPSSYAVASDSAWHSPSSIILTIRNTMYFRKKISFVFSVAILFSVLAISSAQAAKNVIVMISDGAGYNSWLAASMYQGKVGKQAYDRPGWVKLSCATYPLNRKNKPTGNDEQDKAVAYDPFKAWDASRIESKPGEFAGYAYLKSTPTDSAAAATAMASGRKTYNTSINWDNRNRPMIGATIAEIAKSRSKSAGVVTSVPWSHATPSGFGGAHNVSRNNLAEIANEMLGAAWLDVIMGAGNPDFDADGRPRKKPKPSDYTYVGGKKTWELLKNDRHPAGWKLLENKEDFEKLAEGNEPPPAKLLGIPQVATTLQQKRARVTLGSGGEKRPPVEPFETPLTASVPSLAAMSKAAIRALEKNPNGFYLMIEGGAVDWANHANQPERTIEEQVDFVQAVDAVVAWIEQNGGWDDTLLILTADHECGNLWGPDSDKTPYQPLVDNGPGKMPGMKHNHAGHANSLVPLYARGADAERFKKLVKGKDEMAAAVWNISGEYVDNTAVFRVMKAAMEREAIR